MTRGAVKLLPLASFNDVAEVLDTLIARDDFTQATYRLPTSGKARNFVARANQYRVALRRNFEATNKVPLGTGHSPYDHLSFSSDGTAVIIKARRAEGILTVDGEQTSITPDPATQPEEIDLDDFAPNKG